MAYSRNPYLSGSPYPTGIAPLTLDLEKNISAITQQMVKSRQEEIKERKLEIEQSEKDILTALDFKSLEGAGDQFAMEQAERLNKLTDEWTRRWKEGGGILTTKDKLDLLKDKRDIEQKLSVGTAELAQIKLVQEDLAKNENYIFDKEKTAPLLAEYLKKGLAGTGGFINIPVLRKYPFGANFLARFDPFIKQRAETFTDETKVINRATGQVSIAKTNRKSVDEGIEWLKTTPEYLELYKSDPVQAEFMVEGLRRKYLSEPEEEKFISAVKPRVSGGGVSTEKAEQMTVQEDAISKFYERAEGLRNLDADTINEFLSNEWNEVGKINYRSKDNALVIEYNLAQGGKGKGNIEIKVPTDPNDEKAMDAFRRKVWDIYPEKLKGSLEKMTVDQILQKKREVKKGTYRKISSLEEESIKESIDKLEYKQRSIDAFIRDIKVIVPDLKITRSSYGRKIIIGEKEYVISDPKSKEELMNDIKKIAGINKGEQVVLNNPDRKFRLKSGRIVTAQEMVDGLVATGMSMEEAIKKVNSK